MDTVWNPCSTAALSLYLLLSYILLHSAAELAVYD